MFRLSKTLKALLRPPPAVTQTLNATGSVYTDTYYGDWHALRARPVLLKVSLCPYSNAFPIVLLMCSGRAMFTADGVWRLIAGVFVLGFFHRARLSIESHASQTICQFCFASSSTTSRDFVAKGQSHFSRRILTNIHITLTLIHNCPINIYYYLSPYNISMKW